MNQVMPYADMGQHNVEPRLGAGQKSGQLLQLGDREHVKGEGDDCGVS